MHCLLTIALNGYVIHIVWVNFSTPSTSHALLGNSMIISSLSKSKHSCVNIPFKINSGSSIVDLSVAPSANLWNNNLFFVVTLRYQII